MVLEYNTERNDLIISEYGRNVQRMARHLHDIADRSERTKAAAQVIEVMALLNPSNRDAVDYKQKLWDHLYLIAGTELDIDAPFPKPEKDVVFHQNRRPGYPNEDIKIRHYGKIIERMIDEAVAMPEGPERQSLCEYIANFMKMSYRNWNKVVINDEDIFQDLKKLSRGEIMLSSDVTVLESNYGGHSQQPIQRKNFKNKGRFNNRNKKNNR
ncbi:MAG: DUF4290 domain-containing protein [Bacteroidia bacterium]